MTKVINGIQQVGIGVADAKAVFNWYRKNFGFDILVFEDEAPASLMHRYTGGTIRKRYALLSLNLQGGGGLELWEARDSVPQPAIQPILLGDYGINIMKIRSNDLQRIHRELHLGATSVPGPIVGPSENPQHFYLCDPWNNWLQIVSDSYVFADTKRGAGGVSGAIVGVSDMAVSLEFYGRVLGYDRIHSDTTGIFPELAFFPGGEGTFRKVKLTQPDMAVGGFGELLGPTEIELLQAIDRKGRPVFEGRWWGDLGFIHLCFDVREIERLRSHCMDIGYPFTVDSRDSFGMGDASGHFGYLEDPDGTLIELVETHRVPLLKSLGLYIHLKNRPPLQPLPRWLIMGMRLRRKYKDLK